MISSGKRRLIDDWEANNNSHRHDCVNVNILFRSIGSKDVEIHTSKVYGSQFLCEFQHPIQVHLSLETRGPPQPDVWPMEMTANLVTIEASILEDRGFKISRFGSHSLLHQCGANVGHPTTRDGKVLRYNPPSNPQYQQIALAQLFTMISVDKMGLIPPSDGRIYVNYNWDNTIHIER